MSFILEQNVRTFCLINYFAVIMRLHLVILDDRFQCQSEHTRFPLAAECHHDSTLPCLDSAFADDENRFFSV